MLRCVKWPGVWNDREQVLSQCSHSLFLVNQSFLFSLVKLVCFFQRGRDYDVFHLHRSLAEPGPESPGRLGPVDTALLPKKKEGTTKPRLSKQQTPASTSCVSVKTSELGQKAPPGSGSQQGSHHSCVDCLLYKGTWQSQQIGAEIQSLACSPCPAPQHWAASPWRTRCLFLIPTKVLTGNFRSPTLAPPLTPNVWGFSSQQPILQLFNSDTNYPEFVQVQHTQGSVPQTAPTSAVNHKSQVVAYALTNKL